MSGGTLMLDFNAAGDAFVSYECSDERIAYKKVGQTAWTEIKLTIAGIFPDRDMVTIDNAPGSPFFGSVYVGYDDNGSNNAPFVLYSRDGFTNWKRSAKVANGNPTIGVNVATGPDGSVYATWEDYSGKKLWTAKSTDGAATFGPAVVVKLGRSGSRRVHQLVVPPATDHPQQRPTSRFLGTADDDPVVAAVHVQADLRGFAVVERPLEERRSAGAR